MPVLYALRVDGVPFTTRRAIPPGRGLRRYGSAGERAAQRGRC